MRPNEGTMEVPKPTLATVLAKENLNKAWKAVKANKEAPGPDGRDIARSEAHIREHWESIERKLKDGQFEPGPVRAVMIPKPNGGERTLGVPNVQDRWIHQAIHEKLSERCEPFLSEHSYGFRPNRSAHDAIRAAQEYVKQGKRYVVDIDLKSFFDAVDHDKLMHLLDKHVEDKSLKKLIGAILRAPVQRPDGSRYKLGKGTPQGGPLSPLLANIDLDPLDKVTEWIEKNLKVPVNREKSGSGPTGASALLGFRLEEDGTITIAPKSIQRLKSKGREVWDARQSVTSEELREQWRSYIEGWWNYFQLAERRKEVEDQTGWIRRHMRKCFLLRWSTPKGRLNALRRLGIGPRARGLACSGLGAWRIARLWQMHQALSNQRLHQHGFILPWAIAEAAT